MSALQDQPINTSFLSPIGFKFQLNNFPAVNYFCQSATLPGISIGTISVPTPLKTIELSGDEVTFEELSIKFIVDENMKNWLSIYDWIIGLGFPTEEGQAKYKKLAEKNGCSFYKRVPALGIEENFIKGVAELVLQKETRENFVSSVMCPNKYVKCPCLK